MKFSDIAGLTEVKKRLVLSVKNNRVPHAMMFCGNEGSGGLPLAFAFSQYLCCENKTDDDSCGICPPCHKNNKLIHPDIHFAYPVIKKTDKPPLSTDFIAQWREAILSNHYITYFDWLGKLDAENKQGNITVAECHDIIRKLSLKTYEGNFKILIFWLPEYLGKNGNALLKLIEEPPEYTVIIFVTNKKDNILNTIQSRTQQILLPPLETNDITNMLVSSLEIEHYEAIRIAELSSGSYTEALRIASHTMGNHTSDFISWMRKCIKIDGLEILKWTSDITQNGREYLKDFILAGMRIIRETTLFHHHAAEITSQSEEEKTFGERFSVFMTHETALSIYKLLDDAHYHIERNASPKIVFFNLSLQINKLLANKPQ